MLKYTHSRLIAFVGVSFIILFCYFPAMLIFAPHFYPAFPLTITISSALLTFGALMVLVTHFIAVFAEPGFYQPTRSSMMAPFEEKEIKAESLIAKEKIADLRKRQASFKTGNRLSMDPLEGGQFMLETQINDVFLEQSQKVTYCFACQHVKPVRCHHCKSCGKCVLRMDHHCPWTGNCVGEDNLKFFIQFLFYASVTILLYFPFQGLLLLFGGVQLDSFITTLIAFNTLSSIAIGVPIAYLLSYQLRNAWINVTTVEDYVRGFRQLRPFDKGARHNLEQVFGTGFSLGYLACPLVGARPAATQLI